MTSMIYFVAGCLSVVVIIAIVVAVVGMVWLVKLGKEVRRIDGCINDVWMKFIKQEEDFSRQLDIEVTGLNSEIDSRLDKFENRLKNNK